jgi:hypothetical protein
MNPLLDAKDISGRFCVLSNHQNIQIIVTVCTAANHLGLFVRKFVSLQLSISVPIITANLSLLIVIMIMRIHSFFLARKKDFAMEAATFVQIMSVYAVLLKLKMELSSFVKKEK